MNILNNIYIAT